MSKRVNSYEGRAEMSGKPPIPQLPPRQKQRRPNQRPPQRRASAPGSLPGSSDGEEHGGEEPIDNEPYDSDGEAVGPSSSFVDWGERQKRRNEALRKQLGDLKECYLLNLPLATRFFELDQQHQINQHQSRLDSAWQLHQCSVFQGCPALERFELVRHSDIEYMGLSCMGKLSVPEWQCSCCQQTVSPHPSVLGCFPSGPIACNLWYDLRFMQLYEQLGLSEGLSATGTWYLSDWSRTQNAELTLDFTGYLAGLHNMHQAWHPGARANSISSNSFHSSVAEYFAVMGDLDDLHRLKITEDMDRGPFCRCPICCRHPEGNRMVFA